MNRARGNTTAGLTVTAATSSGGMPVPRHVCWDCGEFLPHACAPAVTILREKWTGRRVVSIQNRQPARQETELEKRQADPAGATGENARTEYDREPLHSGGIHSRRGCRDSAGQTELA